MESQGQEPLGRLLGMTGRFVHEACNAALSPMGSSMPTFLVLKMAQDWPDISQRQLARVVGVEGPTISHHLDRLEADGLVVRRRASGDRRVVLVEVTDQGREHFEKAVEIMSHLDDEFRSLYTERELASLRRLIGRLRDHLMPDHMMEEANVNAAG